jgi:ElaB/YqjD/DUF883 family membrane-anchored ribosome-binding protein
MTNNPGSVDELENRAARERERLNRDVVELRQGVRREMDVRGRVEDNIHSRPGVAYGVAAAAALFVGFALSRALS